MDVPFDCVSGTFLLLEFGSLLLIFVYDPGIVVASLDIGIFSEEGEVQLWVAHTYTFVVLLQL